MNIYLIQEDGECNCYKGETPQEAIDAAAHRFLMSLTDDELMKFEEEHGERPMPWWNRTCFESCALVGELVNG